jgi:SAM-dependent methyltransferase
MRGEAMSEDTGSYHFGTYQREEELKRLEAQATATWAVEAPLLAAAGLGKNQRVLDLGCGPGFLSRNLAEVVGPSGGVICVDVNDDLLAVARSLPPLEGSGAITYRRGSAYGLDIPSGSVDFVYSRLLFQHLEDPRCVIQECFRVLKAGGGMCVVDSDDGVLGLFPEPPGYAQFTRRAAELQQARGGDRDVGRKIGWFYKGAGFTGVQVRVLVFTTDQVPMKAFLDIAVAFKKESFPPDERARAAEQVESFYRYMDRPDGFGLAGLYVVSARKPV